MDYLSFQNLVENNRSFRRFDNNHKIDIQTLKDLVGLARVTASAANMQPLKYIICSEELKNRQIFSTLGWAGYLKDWQGPVKEEQPTGYIVILGDKTIAKNFWCDHGIAAQTILLGARTIGLGGCMLANINRPELIKHLKIEAHLEILLVLALGKPVEQVEIDIVNNTQDIKYYRDKKQVHHVPKRKLEDIIISSW